MILEAERLLIVVTVLLSRNCPCNMVSDIFAGWIIPPICLFHIPKDLVFHLQVRISFDLCNVGNTVIYQLVNLVQPVGLIIDVLAYGGGIRT